MRKDGIEIVGADANNLRDIDLEIPARGVTMVTGVSGSGKSSLVDDTLAAEAERRVHVFLQVKSGAPRHEATRAFIGPLPPSIRVGQRAFRASARTTVGTATGLLSLIRRIYLEHAVPWSVEAAESVPRPGLDSYARWLVRNHEGPADVWAIPVWHEATDGSATIARLKQAGTKEVVITTVRVSAPQPRASRPIAIDKARPLDPTARHVIEANAGHVQINREAAREVTAALRRAWDWADGRVAILLPGDDNPALASDSGPRLFTEDHWVHPDSKEVFAPPSQNLLTFNAPKHAKSGACPTCEGIGRARTIDEHRLVRAPDKSMHEGAFALWTPKGTYKHVNIREGQIEGLRGIDGFNPDVPWRKLSDAARRLVLSGGVEVAEIDRESHRAMTKPFPFEGFRPAILRRAAGGSGQALAEYVVEGPCPTCGGSRWSSQARALRVGKFGLADLLGSTLAELAEATGPNGAFTRAVPAEARGYVSAIHRLASSFVSVGLGHLSGDRGMLDVSQGESRRLQLASVLFYPGSGLLLLLDEPARGLHEEDVGRLVEAISALGARHAVVVS